jgi:6-phosphogluconolactonase (cycloisomerase 2 family)
MIAFFRTILLLLILALAAAGCGGSSRSSNAPIAFLYAIGPGANSIQGFGASSTGALSGLSVPSFATSPIPVAITLHPSKNFVYVANSTSNVVSGFSLNHTSGVLTPVGTAISPTPVGKNPVALGANANGQFLFVLNQGSTNISAFSVDATRGLLAEISGSPFSLPSAPQTMVISPTAGFLYVASNTASTTSISTFAIGSDGKLTSSGSLSLTGAKTPSIAGMTIDPKGQLFYAADSSNNTIRAFNIQSSGALSEITGSPFAAGTQPVSVTVDATSTLLYSANQGSNDVSAFRITNTGALGPAPGSPYATAGSGVITASQPVFVTVDATNGFLYVANQGGSIAAFSIKVSDGSLTFVTNPPLVPNTPPSALLSSK